MTTTTDDLLRGTEYAVPAFAVHVSVVRYLRAGDAASAAAAARQGITLAHGAISTPPAVIDTAAVLRADAVPYRHAGEDGLWRVTVDIDGVIRCADSATAAEAAHQLVTVARGGDAFEPELEVFPVDRLH